MTNDYFVNPDNIKLFRIVYKPTVEPLKAAVFLCHGLFEHCESAYYDTIVHPLNDIGCMVITHDHQGHGRSGGDRGMIYKFGNLVRDVLLDIDDVIKANAISVNTPVFLYGHSMGGLISVYASLERDSFFKGMCLEAPALKFPTKIGSGKICMGKFVSVLCPSFQLDKLDLADLSRDTVYVELVSKDQLRIDKGVPAKTAMELLNAMNTLHSNFVRVTTPFFIGHGEADELAELDGSKMMMKISPVEDKTLVTYPNAKHQLRMEIDNVNVDFLGKAVQWIKERINK